MTNFSDPPTVDGSSGIFAQSAETIQLHSAAMFSRESFPSLVRHTPTVSSVSGPDPTGRHLPTCAAQQVSGLFERLGGARLHEQMRDHQSQLVKENKNHHDIQGQGLLHGVIIQPHLGYDRSRFRLGLLWLHLACRLLVLKGSWDLVTRVIMRVTLLITTYNPN